MKQQKKLRYLDIKIPLEPFRRVWAWMWKRNLLHSIFLLVSILVIAFTAVSYGIAQWYINKHKKEPLTYGATFIPTYAKNFGLDPKATLQASIDELGIKRYRLVSYWDLHEKEPGHYDFTELDWQFKMIEDAGGEVSLAIGLRQPRWPECHMPSWAERLTKRQWTDELKKYMGVVIERYKDSPALKEYQLENEYFLKVFGICPDHSRDRLIEEYNYVKTADPSHPVIVNRSNNALGLPIGAPRPDKFGVSVYKRVWDRTLTKRYFEYPLPAWFYSTLAGGGEILTGKELIIHELQAEAWLPPDLGYAMNDVDSIPEQNKSMNPKRLRDRIQYAEDSGIRTIDLWGVEWWYWRKQVGDPSLWDTAKAELNNRQGTTVED